MKKKSVSDLIGRSRDEAFALVLQLLDDFEAYRERYLEASYLEPNARTDFIDKFWMALGWDVWHLTQSNPYTQEVRIEESQSTEAGRKRPDYSFYAAPEFRDPKFFVEAKRPSTVAQDTDHLLQTARYGWMAGLPIVALHNVVELLVIDSRFRVDATTVSQRIAAKFAFTTLRTESEFDKLYWLFSREAVSQGAIEAFASALPTAKRAPAQHGLFQGGYRPIDAALLETLEQWRTQLARMLKNRNAWLDGPTLTEVTQRILDRLVMIRFLEDKQIESRIGIETIAKKGESWGNFQKASRQLDSIYNGIIFKHHSLVDEARLLVDDAAFLAICDELDPRSTSSEYNFAQIPIQILGSIYERFLGNVIVTTEHRATIKNRPEVVKAGGIYYTPTHIVHYIVDATINPIVRGKSFAELKKLRIIDTACGSGSFLIAAFDKLIMAAADWFNHHPEKAKAAGCVAVGEGWRLSLKQKRELLVHCIYGIDLDHQAIEVAQLSLFLKLLEEETAGSTIAGQREIEQALLPSLAYNIVNGNALIDVDFYDDDLFPDDDLRLRPIPLERTFHKVFAEGGFDAIVGNPPYLFITELSEPEKAYFQRKYASTQYRFDIYGLFIERAISLMLKKAGRLGYIVPHTLLANDSFEKLRRLLLENAYIEQVVDIGPGVFQKAKNETMILVLENGPPHRRKTVVRVTEAKSFPTAKKDFKIAQTLWSANPGASWLVNVDHDETQFIETMEQAAKWKLGELCTVNQGLRTGNNERYLATMKGGRYWERAAGGAEVQRYQPIQDTLWVYYDPAVLDAPRKRELFDRDEKIVVQEIRNISLRQRIVATLDRKRTFCLQSTNVIGRKLGVSTDLRYIMGVISSNAMNRYFRLRFPANNHIASNQLAALPIPQPTAQIEARIADLVDKLLDTTEALAIATAEHAKRSLQVKRDSLDLRIEQLVENVFGLPAAQGGD